MFDRRPSGGCCQAEHIKATCFSCLCVSLQTTRSRIRKESSCFVPHQSATVVFTHVQRNGSKGATPPVSVSPIEPYQDFPEKVVVTDNFIPLQDRGHGSAGPMLDQLGCPGSGGINLRILQNHHDVCSWCLKCRRVELSGR